MVDYLFKMDEEQLHLRQFIKMYGSQCNYLSIYWELNVENINLVKICIY